MPEKLVFEGTVCLVWYNDGKQKFRFVTGNADLKKEIARLRETGVPHSAMMALAIDWENDKILTFTGERPEPELS